MQFYEEKNGLGERERQTIYIDSIFISHQIKCERPVSHNLCRERIRRHESFQEQPWDNFVHSTAYPIAMQLISEA